MHCEVHGRVPYLRTGGSYSSPGVPNSALPLIVSTPLLAQLEVTLPAALPPLLVGTQVEEVLLPAPPASADAGPPPCSGEAPAGQEQPLGEAPRAGPPPPADAAPPDAVIDVPRLEHLVRARKAEAASLRHLMTHHPKNKYCPTCCIAKCQRAPHRRKHHKYWKGRPRPTAFGDEITADHIVAYSVRSQGITGHQAAVVFGDRATGWFDGFPIAGKTAPDTSDALRRFMGSETGMVRQFSRIDRNIP